MKDIKKGEFYLIKSKDDLSLMHNTESPLCKLTGFTGTAGEAVQDYNGDLTLFVDPRYHIQADNETRGKNVKVVKLEMGTSFIKALKSLLKKDDTLFIPTKSTLLGYYKLLKKEFNIKTYDTEDEKPSSSKIVAVSDEITGANFKEKIKKLRTKLKGQNLYITSLEEVSWLLNLRSFEIKNTSSIRAKVLVESEKVTVFSNDKIPFIEDEIRVLPLSKLKSVLTEIKDEILIDQNSITLFDYNLIKNPKTLKTNYIANFASQKNKKELAHLKDCFKRLDNALFAFQEQIKEGKSEFELKEIFEKELKRFGALGTSFKTILALGKNSSSIHYSAWDKEKFIKKDEILLIDCGGYYEGGYATDITRVFVCSGKNVSKEVKKIYTAVLKAQLNCFFGNFKDGGEMDKKARKILEPYKKEGFLFPHSLGHGVGIPVHQAPPVITSNPKYNSKIKDKMVFTIEPGLYCEGKFGIRLENTVYFDKKTNKRVTLSKFPYEEKLIDFEALTSREKKWLKIWQEGRQNG